MKSRIKGFGSLVTATFLLFAVGGHAVAGGLYERDFADADFSNSTTIDNPFWPLVPGAQFIYFAETEDGCEWNLVTVTEYTYEILGVETVVVEDMEWLDDDEDCADRMDDYPGGFPYGDLTEETDDWYAQDELKNIWYMGEDTSSYDWEEGECDVVVGLACKDGSFEAGMGEAEAGIVMLGDPSKGDFYQQEYDPDNAEDMGKVLNFVVIDDMDCLKTKEWTPLEPGAVEHKYYCFDEDELGFSVLYLINEISGGPQISVELVDVTLP